MALLEVQVTELESAQHVRKQATRLVFAGDRAVAREMSKEIAADAILCMQADMSEKRGCKIEMGLDQ